MLARVGVLVAACLAGVAGLGLEVLLLDLAGLALGHGRSAALGLAIFLVIRAGYFRRAPGEPLEATA